jgi:CO/xanthine dehydrogenase FAD-binding subunit
VRNFSYARAADIDGALRLAAQPGAQLIAGGTNLLDLMKGGVAAPDRLIDITQIAALAQIHELPTGGLRIGALMRNSDAAQQPLRIAPVAQHGHRGRQHLAENAMQLFLRYGLRELQQKEPGIGL